MRVLPCLVVLGIASLPAAVLGQEALGVSNGQVVTANLGTCGSVIYDTTHASNQGAEIAVAANGAATSLADAVVVAGTNRFICQIDVDMFVLNDGSNFDMTVSLFSDCTTNGAGNSPCGNGVGTPIGSPVTVSNITPPAIGAIFTVAVPFPLVDISGDADDTITVSINPSRANVLWRIGETPTVGAIPAGEPATSFVQRCGSVGANNGCQRNFGVNNNFAMVIRAEAFPVELESFSVGE